MIISNKLSGVTHQAYRVEFIDGEMRIPHKYIAYTVCCKKLNNVEKRYTGKYCEHCFNEPTYSLRPRRIKETKLAKLFRRFILKYTPKMWPYAR